MPPKTRQKGNTELQSGGKGGEKSFIKAIKQWPIPEKDLQLRVQWTNGNFYGEKDIRKRLSRFGAIAHTSQGGGSVSGGHCTYYHLYGSVQCLSSRDKFVRALVDGAYAVDLALHLGVNCDENCGFWFAGLPESAGIADFDVIGAVMVKRLEEREADYKFEANIDARRRELLITIKSYQQRPWTGSAEQREIAAEMVAGNWRRLKNELVWTNGNLRHFVTRPVDLEYVKKWTERREKKEPLTKLEREAMAWTDEKFKRKVTTDKSVLKKLKEETEAIEAKLQADKRVAPKKPTSADAQVAQLKKETKKVEAALEVEKKAQPRTRPSDPVLAPAGPEELNGDYWKPSNNGDARRSRSGARNAGPGGSSSGTSGSTARGAPGASTAEDDEDVASESARKVRGVRKPGQEGAAASDANEDTVARRMRSGERNTTGASNLQSPARKKKRVPRDEGSTSGAPGASTAEDNEEIASKDSGNPQRTLPGALKIRSRYGQSSSASASGATDDNLDGEALKTEPGEDTRIRYVGFSAEVKPRHTPLAHGYALPSSGATVAGGAAPQDAPGSSGASVARISPRKAPGGAEEASGADNALIPVKKKKMRKEEPAAPANGPPGPAAQDPPHIELREDDVLPERSDVGPPGAANDPPGGANGDPLAGAPQEPPARADQELPGVPANDPPGRADANLLAAVPQEPPPARVPPVVDPAAARADDDPLAVAPPGPGDDGPPRRADGELPGAPANDHPGPADDDMGDAFDLGDDPMEAPGGSGQEGPQPADSNKLKEVDVVSTAEQEQAKELAREIDEEEENNALAIRNLPLHFTESTVPLCLRFGGTKYFYEDEFHGNCSENFWLKMDKEERLRFVLRRFGNLAEAETTGCGDVRLEFFHPFSSWRFLSRKTNARILAQDSETSLIFEKSEANLHTRNMDNGFIWMGGVPLNLEKNEYSLIAEVIETRMMTREQKEHRRFTFSTEYDSIRGELLITPTGHEECDSDTSIAEMIIRQLPILADEPVLHNGKMHFLIARGASEEFAKAFRKRCESQLPLTPFEHAAIQRTLEMTKEVWEKYPIAKKSSTQLRRERTEAEKAIRQRQAAIDAEPIDVAAPGPSQSIVIYDDAMDDDIQQPQLEMGDDLMVDDVGEAPGVAQLRIQDGPAMEDSERNAPGSSRIRENLEDKARGQQPHAIPHARMRDEPALEHVSKAPGSSRESRRDAVVHGNEKRKQRAAGVNQPVTRDEPAAEDTQHDPILREPGSSNAAIKTDDEARNRETIARIQEPPGVIQPRTREAAAAKDDQQPQRVPQLAVKQQPPSVIQSGVKDAAAADKEITQQPPGAPQHRMNLQPHSIPPLRLGDSNDTLEDAEKNAQAPGPSQIALQKAAMAQRNQAMQAEQARLEAKQATIYKLQAVPGTSRQDPNVPMTPFGTPNPSLYAQYLKQYPVFVPNQGQPVAPEGQEAGVRQEEKEDEEEIIDPGSYDPPGALPELLRDLGEGGAGDVEMEDANGVEEVQDAKEDSAANPLPMEHRAASASASSDSGIARDEEEFVASTSSKSVSPSGGGDVRKLRKRKQKDGTLLNRAASPPQDESVVQSDAINRKRYSDRISGADDEVVSKRQQRAETPPCSSRSLYQPKPPLMKGACNGSHDEDKDEDEEGRKKRKKEQCDDVKEVFFANHRMEDGFVKKGARKKRRQRRWMDNQMEEKEVVPEYIEKEDEFRFKKYQNDVYVKQAEERLNPAVTGFTAKELNDMDRRFLEHRLVKAWQSHIKPGTKRKNQQRDYDEQQKKQESAKKYIIEGIPYTTPSTYELIGEKDEVNGPLPFYNTSDSKIIEMPEYKFIRKNENDRNDRALESKVADTNVCKHICTCDPNIGCNINTCECMQQSAYRNGRVDITEKEIIVECCSDCPCKRKKCPTVVKIRPLRFHVVHTDEMGFGLRVLEPVQRGEPILEFTGEYTSNIQEGSIDEKWAFTTASWKDEDWNRVTGLDHKKKHHTFCINPLRKGNASRFICHSFFANVEWMCVYKNGDRYARPRSITFALEPLEIGDFLYLDYGVGFGIKRTEEGEGMLCRCTQELCHKKKVWEEWFTKLTWTQALLVLETREINKRKRMRCKEKAAVKRSNESGKKIKQ